MNVNHQILHISYLLIRVCDYNRPLAPDQAGAVSLHAEAGVHVAEARAEHHLGPERGDCGGLAHTSR